MTIYMTSACASCNLHCDIHAWMFYIEQRDKWTPSCWAVRPELHYLQPAHTSTHISVIASPGGSLGFAVNRWPFTPSLCTLCSAQMVSMRFIWQPAPSRAHSGLQDYYRIVKKCFIKKKSHTRTHTHAQNTTPERFLKSAVVCCPSVKG